MKIKTVQILLEVDIDENSGCEFTSKREAAEAVVDCIVLNDLGFMSAWVVNKDGKKGEQVY